MSLFLGPVRRSHRDCFARSVGFGGAADDARGYLQSHVKRPNDDFVRKTKDSIAKVWLPQHGRAGAAVVRELLDIGIGPMGPMPTDAEGLAAYIARCRNTSGLRGLLCERISFGDTDRGEEEEVDDHFLPRFGTVVPAKQALTQPRPYSHQTEA